MANTLYEEERTHWVAFLKKYLVLSYPSSVSIDTVTGNVDLLALILRRQQVLSVLWSPKASQPLSHHTRVASHPKGIHSFQQMMGGGSPLAALLRL